MAVNFGEIKRIDIIGFLERTGIRPVRNYQTYALYHAPYREDRHPSFKVSRKKNRWYDLATRSEEHTSELQSRQYLVCRLLLEKKKKKHICSHTCMTSTYTTDI